MAPFERWHWIRGYYHGGLSMNLMITGKSCGQVKRVVSFRIAVGVATGGGAAVSCFWKNLKCFILLMLVPILKKVFNFSPEIVKNSYFLPKNTIFLRLYNIVLATTLGACWIVNNFYVILTILFKTILHLVYNTCTNLIMRLLFELIWDWHRFWITSYWNCRKIWRCFGTFAFNCTYCDVGAKQLLDWPEFCKS